VSHGILNEVFSPRLDQTVIRDMGLLVTDGRGFFSEEKRHTNTVLRYAEPGIPAYHLTNTCLEQRYRIEKTVLADPHRDVLLQQIRFVPLVGSAGDYQLFALLAPHLRNRGAGNNAWIGNHKGVPMLFAAVDGRALALACSTGWLNASAGFVGVSDGWQDVARHGSMTWRYAAASDGNVALIGQIGTDLEQVDFTLALGFGDTPDEAGHRSLSSLADGFAAAGASYIDGWQAWWAERSLPGSVVGLLDDPLARTSLMVLKVHEAKSFPGGIIASLSIPWGFAKGDDDLGGYHLVWPRDLVEAAGGLLAGGAVQEARRVLTYLQATQEADGHWPQNMWLDGMAYWSGIQMDETALPILLVDLVARAGFLSDEELNRLWPMVRRAASFIVRFGPVSDQDRWEEDPGYTPFTIAAEVAALLAAADLADRQGEPEASAYLRETADVWNQSVERWMYVTGTDLAAESGVDGYYVRVAPPETADAASPAAGFVPIKNRPPGQSQEAATEIVSVDALALVRFGLRAPDDPRVVNTVRVIDRLLRIDLPQGPGFRRYNEDGYGEHEDGSPFDGTGIGRAWPLLTAERAHYELAAGRAEVAAELARTVAQSANDGGMLPEQTWDGPDLPDQELWTGRPSGSAMPLVWAHAEYLKLKRSLLDGRVFDMPPQPVQRYLRERTTSPYSIWRFNHKCRTMHEGAVLRIEVQAPAVVRWSSDGWANDIDVATRDSSLGIHYANLDTAGIPAASVIAFTIRWIDQDRWEGTDFSVTVVEPATDPDGQAITKQKRES
jgi:glucoamylase